MGKLRAFWKKDPGLFVSSIVHVIALVLLVVNFSRAPKFDDQVESVPVEMITTNDLNQIMNGEKTAKQMETPQRRVDKVAELEDHKPAPPLAEAKKDTPPPPSPEKPNADPGDDEKPTEKAAVTPPPAPPEPAKPAVQPPPVPTPPERPVEKVETKPDPPAPPPKPDEVKPEPKEAEALEPKPPPRPKVEPKKAEPKKEPKKVAKLPPKKPPPPKPVEVKEAKVIPDPPKRPEPEKPDLRQRTLDQVAKLLDKLKPENKPEKPVETPPVKQRSGTEAKEAKSSAFSFDKISQLLDHQAPQRTASTGQQLTKLASLGSPTAHAQKMSPSMQAQIDGWLIDHYRGCWSYFGLGATQNYVPKVHVRMAPDGSLMGRPALVNPPSDPNLRSLADSAMRAVNRCDPLPIPDWFKAHYEAWRDRTVRFDPKELS